MDSKKLVLSVDQIDMLSEIFNMGMGQSLGALSKITGKEHEIIFSIPKLKVLTKDDFVRELSKANRTAMIVQNYFGKIQGKAIFYLPASAGQELARLLIGTDIPIDEIEKIESDALIEIGNIFINSSIGCLANFLGTEIETKVPEMIFQDRLATWMAGSDEIIHLNTQFNIKHLKIEGQIALVLDNESVQKFINFVNSQEI